MDENQNLIFTSGEIPTMLYNKHMLHCDFGLNFYMTVEIPPQLSSARMIEIISLKI